MEAVWIQLLDMSIKASWLILAVIVLRSCFRRAPKWMMCVLWAFVAFRLICPVSIESMASLIPDMEIVQQDENMVPSVSVVTELFPENEFVQGMLTEEMALSGALPKENETVTIASVVWLIGMMVLYGYAIGSYLHLKRKLRLAVHLKDNLWQSETVRTPFILGVLHPRIYLPFQEEENSLLESQWEYVIAHEKAHLKRGDHWWKPIGFAVLAQHWFNPLCWIAYWLFEKDIELACDERVIRTLELEEKKLYSKTLLLCSTDHKSVAACPLAFAETDVKNRIQNILNYKKPAVWIVILSIFICAGIAVCFLTNPEKDLEGNADLSEQFLEEQQANTALKSWGPNLSEDYTLAKVLEEDQIIIADGDVINGQEQWQEFIKKTSEGKETSVNVFYYYTLGDKSHYDPTYYESIKDEYPVMYRTHIQYDGQKYIAKDGFSTAEYRYLRKFEGEAPSTATYSNYVRYVLVDDNTVTWEEIEWGMFSSQLGDGIRHETVYTDLD